MLQHTFTNLRTLSFAIVMAAMLMVGTIVPTHQVQAQTQNSEELLSIIEVLLEKIAALQKRINERNEQYAASSEIVIDGSVITIGSLKVRSVPSLNGELISIIAGNTKGTVLDGPVSADGYVWWKIVYDNSVMGWSAQDWLFSGSEKSWEMESISEPISTNANIEELKNVSTRSASGQYSSEEELIQERLYTTNFGQKPGQNLINQYTIAKVNSDAALLTSPDYSSDVVTYQKKGSWGEVIDGPKLVQGDVWWKFKFVNGESGWGTESWFTRYPSSVIMVDLNQDGIAESRYRVMGDYDNKDFTIEVIEGELFVGYEDGYIPFSDIIKI